MKFTLSKLYTQVAKHQSRFALVVNHTLFNKLQTYLDTKMHFQNNGFQKAAPVN